MATAENPVARKRAPRRDGERTTLRVPAELAAQAEVLARRLGTTPNDALILMAERGAASYTRELEWAHNHEHELAAVLEALGPLGPEPDFLPDEEARAAVLLLRTGKYGPIV